MAGKFSHDEYYGQFVTNSGKKYVQKVIGLKRLLKSTDPHMNDIPLADWDRLSMHLGCLNTKLFKEAEECSCKPGVYCWSPASNVCIAKATARAILKEYNAAPQA
jgi:hypothetical protein